MSKFKDAIKDMMKKREKVIKEIALFVESEAKLRTPVKTGHLRRSISHATETNEKVSRARIGTNIEYAPFVEMGTIRTKAQPFLRPAIEENVQEIKEIIKKELKV